MAEEDTGADDGFETAEEDTGVDDGFVNEVAEEGTGAFEEELDTDAGAV